MTHSVTDPTAPVYDAARVASLIDLLSYDSEELRSFGPSPPPIPGYVTFWDPGWSIRRLRVAVSGKGRVFCDQTWYNSESFASAEERSCFRQVRMEPLKNSFHKTYEEPLTFLGPDDEVPTARTVITGMVLHFLATGQRLFPAYWVRCSDTTSDGYRVSVGRFGARGLDVYDCWDGLCFYNLGLAVARKST